MELRRHSLMSFGGIPTWPPPEWVWASGLRNVFIYPKGEVGVLENVKTIYCFSRQVPFYYNDLPRKYLSRSAQFQ
jgi:hypothetical protein